MRFKDAVRGLLGESLRTVRLGVKGHVTIDICDEHGRVLERIEAPNYMNTAQWNAWAKWAQKNTWWEGFVPNGGVTNRALDGRDPRIAPRLSNDILCCWTDGTAEDSTDKFAFGEVTAVAHRWEQGSPGSRQGIVNPTLCTLADDSMSWTWEWSTSAGNGTFQSVGWRRLGNFTDYADVANFSRRAASISSVTNLFDSSISSAVALTVGGTVPGAPILADASNIWLIGTISSAYVLASVPVTFDAPGNYTAGTMVNQSAQAFASALNNSGLPMGMCRIGTDWVSVGSSVTSALSPNTARRPFIRRVTNAGSVSWTTTNSATFTTESVFVDVCYDGTNLWAIGIKGNDGSNAIYRCDPTTGLVSAAISAMAGTPAYFPTWSSTVHPIGLEWDSTNSWLWVCDTSGYIYNMDTSGNWAGALIKSYPAATSALSVTPTGTFAAGGAVRIAKGGSTDWEPAAILGTTVGASALASATNAWSVPVLTFTDPITPTGFGKLFKMDGNLWVPNLSGLSPNMTLTGPYTCYAFNHDPTFATRSLLPVAATKNSGQTMKIRYDIAFT